MLLFRVSSQRIILLELPLLVQQDYFAVILVNTIVLHVNKNYSTISLHDINFILFVQAIFGLLIDCQVCHTHY